jgi:hypothetical protein
VLHCTASMISGWAKLMQTDVHSINKGLVSYRSGILCLYQVAIFDAMTEAVSDVSISFLDPPSEDQWRQILEVVRGEQWHIAHWKYFLVLSKLSFAKAVVSTDDQGQFLHVDDNSFIKILHIQENM